MSDRFPNRSKTNPIPAHIDVVADTPHPTRSPDSPDPRLVNGRFLYIEDAWMVLTEPNIYVADGTSKSCRWCHVFEGLDHARDCPYTIAKRQTTEQAARIEQDSGRGGDSAEGADATPVQAATSPPGPSPTERVWHRHPDEHHHNDPDHPDTTDHVHVDFARMRHTHPDDVPCEVAGMAGHPPRSSDSPDPTHGERGDNDRTHAELMDAMNRIAANKVGENEYKRGWIDAIAAISVTPTAPRLTAIALLRRIVEASDLDSSIPLFEAVQDAGRFLEEAGR